MKNELSKIPCHPNPHIARQQSETCVSGGQKILLNRFARATFLRVKRWLAILFGVLLLGTQFLPAQPVPSSAKCTRTCCDAAHPMPCCVTPGCESQPSTPAVPPQKCSSADQVLIMLPPAVSLTSSDFEANQNVFPPTDFLPAVGAPLYERNCALLL
jgi:hypothetical protein